jgi:hypothetical protein
MRFEDSCFARLTVALIAFAAFCIPLGAQQSPAPQPGVYHCTNGFILTISPCGKIQGHDACNFKIENKGQVLMDTPGSFDGVNKLIRKCRGENVDAPTGPSLAVRSGPTNPPYLSEMPEPARILAEIKGKDVEDTGERQMGAFRALVQMIDDMAWGLGHRYLTNADSSKATPDERRLRFAYETAYADLWHKVTNKEGHVYDHDRALHDELLKKFFTDNFRAQYFQASKNDAAEYAAFEKRMNPTPPPGAAQNGPGGQHYATDEGSVAVRKCVESGRSDLECLGEGMKVGLVDLAGKDSFMGKALQGNKDPGLRLTGTYSAAGVSMTFQQDYVVFSCNGLMPDWHPYSIQLNGSQVKVTVMAGPVTFSYQDGKLVGPGVTNVPGRVQIGPPVATHGTTYQTHTEKEWVNPTAFNSFAPGEVHSDGMGFYVNRKTMSTDAVQTTRYEIPTEPKTVRCNLGAIPATGETPRIADTLNTFIGSNTSKSVNTKPGLRLNGTYAAHGGLSIEFRDDSATLECSEADNSEGYAVVPEGGRLVVKFDNKTGPLSLVLQPNGSLAGQGSIEVAGRRIIQGTGNDPNHFVPANARCTVGTLAPQAAQ